MDDQGTAGAEAGRSHQYIQKAFTPSAARPVGAGAFSLGGLTLTTLAWQIILQAALIALNAVFACARDRRHLAKDARIAALAQEGNRRAVRLARLTNQPARFLATIQVAITLSGFLGSAFAADNFSEPLVDWVVGLGLKASPAVLDTVAVVLITLILSYLTLIFGELVPKRLAMKNAEEHALALSGLVSFISVAFKPIVSLLTVSTNGMLRLLRVDPDEDEDVYSEEEIRMMATAGSQKGTIGAEENEFIQNLFESTTCAPRTSHPPHPDERPLGRGQYRRLGARDLLLAPLALPRVQG